MRGKLSSKGQVTIPKSCRDQLGLKTGSVLDFETVDGALVVRKVQAEDVFRKWRGRGKLPKGLSVDDYLAAVRR
jgi:AbrB family looped-hinge helix DNA binding protein